MKITAYISVLIIILTACSGRKDIYHIENNPPKIEISIDGINYSNHIEDTLKVGYPKSYRYSIKDEENYTVSITATDSIVDQDSILTFHPSRDGLQKISFTASDIYNTEGTATILLHSFINKKPVAQWSYKILGNLSPYEIEINAMASFDSDAKYGGKIVEYEYTIGNYVVNTKRNKLPYIFSSAGQKSISVRVKDNNDEYSEYKTQVIILE